jgi:UDP-glucose 6-dehydrogenase
MKIIVADLGYVGLSNSVLLAQHNDVVGIDLDPGKVAMLKETTFFNSRVVNDQAQFNQEADLFVVNRITDSLRDVESKVYSRNLFGQD